VSQIRIVAPRERLQRERAELGAVANQVRRHTVSRRARMLADAEQATHRRSRSTTIGETCPARIFESAPRPGWPFTDVHSALDRPPRTSPCHSTLAGLKLCGGPPTSTRRRHQQRCDDFEEFACSGAAVHVKEGTTVPPPTCAR
jgi:hypothetical protein